MQIIAHEVLASRRKHLKHMRECPELLPDSFTLFCASLHGIEQIFLCDIGIRTKLRQESICDDVFL